jgi:YD repeat-containing protein
MKFKTLIVLALSITSLFGCRPKPKSVAEIIAQTKDAVILVMIYNERDSLIAEGSGFFISPNEIVTNKHVIEYAKRVEVRTIARKTYLVTYVTGDAKDRDLIRLGVDTRGEKITPIEISREEPVVGKNIVVVGAPLGLEGTVSEGIVSSVRETPQYGRLIQMTASISHSSSGSPVLNTDGEVIGIATLLINSGQNLNFAIPAVEIFEMKPETLLSLTDWKKRMLKVLYKKSASEKIRLAGIKTATEWEYTLAEGEIKGDGIKKRFSTYDRNGNEIEHIDYDDKGEINNHIISRYDTEGRIVEKTSVVDPSEQFWEKQLRDYEQKRVNSQSGEKYQKDIESAKSMLAIIHAHPSRGVWRYRYDDKGNCLEEIHYVDKDTTKTSNKFDEKGHKIEGERIDSKGKVLSHNVRKYDERGNEIEVVNFIGDRKFASVTTRYQYDPNGNMLETVRTNFDSTGSIWWRILSSYDEFERLVREVSDIGSTSTTAYTYDDKSNVIQELMSDGMNEYTTCNTYDEYGNLMEVMKRSENKLIGEIPPELKKRIIHYEYYSVEDVEHR